MGDLPILEPTLSGWLAGSLLLSLRIAPVFGFAPPFTLTRLPAQYRLLLGLGLSASMVAATPAAVLVDLSPGPLLLAAARELALGLLVTLAFQLVFAGLYIAGRTVDIQAGFGLAALIDPTTRSQMPLVGTLFAYATAALFFAADGHIELLRILSVSLDQIPLGGWTMPASLDRLGAFIAAAFLSAFGVAGASIGALFAIDIVIALLSRTVPQMNALVLGFQVKTIALLLILPLSFGLGGALLVRASRMMIEGLPGLIAPGLASHG